MTGADWIKLNSQPSDIALLSIAFSAITEITVPSRLRRKALQYLDARDAFVGQLARNGVYPR